MHHYHQIIPTAEQNSDDEDQAEPTLMERLTKKTLEKGIDDPIPKMQKSPSAKSVKSKNIVNSYNKAA